MIVDGLYEGLPWSGAARARLASAYPDGTVDVTTGTHYETEASFPYLLRVGKRAVIAPRMAYGAEISRALLETYGEGEQLVGDKDLSEACGDHS